MHFNAFRQLVSSRARNPGHAPETPRACAAPAPDVQGPIELKRRSAGAELIGRLGRNRADGPASQTTKPLLGIFTVQRISISRRRALRSMTDLQERSGHHEAAGCLAPLPVQTEQTLPLAASRRRIRALNLDPVANIVDSPSSHADEQLDGGGEITRQHVAPQRRL